MTRRRILRAMILCAVGAFALGACQGAPPPPPKASVDAATLAAEALAAGEYGRAIDLYRRALETGPEGVPLHYGLGVAASHLDRKQEAIREFLWVLERGQTGSEEVEAARYWLWRVGALPRAGSSAAAAAAKEEQKPGTASLEGRAVFGESDRQATPMRGLRLFLVRQPGRDEHYTLRTDEEGRFRFPNVAPGSYKLSNGIAGTPIWRLRVDLAAGQNASLDLTPANSLKARDDFPETPSG